MAKILRSLRTLAGVVSPAGVISPAEVVSLAGVLFERYISSNFWRYEQSVKLFYARSPRLV